MPDTPIAPTLTDLPHGTEVTIVDGVRRQLPATIVHDGIFGAGLRVIPGQLSRGVHIAPQIFYGEYSYDASETPRPWTWHTHDDE